MGATELVVIVLVTLGVIILGAGGLTIVAAGIMWLIRSRRASAQMAEERNAAAPAKSEEPARQPAKATPKPGATAARSTPKPDKATGTPKQFAPPPPPPPFQPMAPAPPATKKPGPLIGFFDEEKGEDAKTEVFTRDAAARYAAMLDDADEGDHTELFSKHDDMDPEVAAILEEEQTKDKIKKRK